MPLRENPANPYDFPAEADDLEPTYVRVWGTVKCQRACSECDGFHHWYDDSIDPDDRECVLEFYRDRPGLQRLRGCEEFLLAHAVCKHCKAVADIDFEEAEA